MSGEPVVDLMRAEWNGRAEEDANYYVAFGRKNQSQEEFFDSGADVVRALEMEMKRRPPEFWPKASALEIGCGPGRLMKPMSRHFGEIHGVDIAEEMIHRARQNLAGAPNVRLHHVEDSSLSEFPGESFDFIYSYAVFQHIPSRDIVMSYLEHAVRVLRKGGLFVFQISGLPDQGHQQTTWNGVRISAEEIIAFARRMGVLLLQLNDRDTQYMWVTLQKPGWEIGAVKASSIRKIANAYTGERAIPSSGRFGAASIWIENLPDQADLLSLSAKVNGEEALGCYVSPVINRLRFYNILIPAGTRTGFAEVDLLQNGEPLCPRSWARITRPGPRVPRVVSVTDGVNLISSLRIETGLVKMVMEELVEPARIRIGVAGCAIPYESFCVNPLHERYEFNFYLPKELSPGLHNLQITLDGLGFAPVPIHVSRAA